MARRVVLGIVGVLLVIAGLAASGAAAWAYLAIGTDGLLRYPLGVITPSAAASSVIVDVERFSVDVPVVGLLGEPALSVQREPGSAGEVFLGAAATDHADAYLKATAYAVALRQAGQWAVTEVPGTSAPADPSAQGFWLAQDAGPRASIAVPADRPLTLVMTTSSGGAIGPVALSADVTIAGVGAWVLWLAVGAGVALLAGVLVLWLAFRRRRSRGRHAAGAVQPEPEAEPVVVEAEPVVVEAEPVVVEAEPVVVEAVSAHDETQEIPVVQATAQEGTDDDVPG